MCIERADHGLAVYKNRVYAFSGYQNNTNEYYEMGCEAWFQVANLPEDI
jgi:hypothetical protein